MKKTLALALITASIMTTVPAVRAARINGPWATEAINQALDYGIITTDKADMDYTKPLTRIDIAELAVRAYEAVSGDKYISTAKPFTDTSSPYAASAYELGIMNGRETGEFAPGDFTTRQEIAKIILSLKAVCSGIELELLDVRDTHLKDFHEVSDWAKPYVYKAVYDGIIKGYEDDTFKSRASVSWQEAITLIIRVADIKTDSKPIVSDKLIIETAESVPHGNVTLKWSTLPDVHTYTLKVTESRLSYYEGDISPNEPQIYTVTDACELEIYMNPNRKYTVEVTGGEHYTFRDIFTSKVTNDDAEEIKANLPTTKEEADALMTTVTVPVWRLNDGNKVPSTAEITVHHLIADKIKLVFEEIYSGDEKFPFKDIGGYAWRGGRSEHNSGTALDLNYNENYCLYKDGTTVGEYWKPGEDPYSITPYGDVIRAFEKYGFTWGGDSWAHPKDYMHFSYLGT